MSRDTITLQYPITVDGEEITELTLRRPKVADMKRGQRHKNDMDKIIHLISDLAEVSPSVIEELDAADFTAVSDHVGNYMGGSGAAG